MPTRDPIQPRRRRRWLRLSLRGLLVLIVLAALPLGWLTNQIRGRRAAVAAITAADAEMSAELAQPTPDDRWTSRLWYWAVARLVPWVGLEAFESVESLSIQQLATGDLLAHIGWLRELEDLIVSDTAQVKTGWHHLAGLQRLETLSLDGPGVDDAALAAVGQLRSLRKLNLDQTVVTDAGFARLADLPRLAELRITDCPGLTDAGAARLLAGLPALADVCLRQLAPGSRAATVAALGRHRATLTSLDLQGLPITDTDLATLGTFDGLTQLDLDEARLTDAGLVHLRRLVQLRSLNIGAAGVTDAGLAHLADLTQLGWLYLSDARVTDAGLVSLSKLHLRTLDLSRTRVTDVGLATVGQQRALYYLRLIGLPGVTDAGLAHLHGLHGLQYLFLHGTAVTDAGVAAIEQAIPNLIVRRSLSNPFQ